jgi:hypothetical protein
MNFDLCAVEGFGVGIGTREECKILRCRVMDYWFGWERHEFGIVDG